MPRVAMVALLSALLANVATLSQINPCPEYLEHLRDAQGIYYGKLTLPNDYSGSYFLAVNGSLPFRTNQRMSIEVDNYDSIVVQPVAHIVYRLHFGSKEAFPKITSVVFNGRTYCSSDPYPVTKNGVTNLWAHSNLEASIQTANRIEQTVVPYWMEQTTQQVWSTTQAPRPWSTAQTSRPWTATQKLQETTTTTTRTTAAATQSAWSCGEPRGSLPLIIRGDEVTDGEFPWLLALFYFDKRRQKYVFHCAANLISDRHAITAGHCVQYESVLARDKEDLMLVMGTFTINNWSTGRLAFVADIDVHPEYSQARSGHDVAILTLKDRVEFSQAVRPVCLWSGDEKLDGIVRDGGTIAGWGQSTFEQSNSNILFKLHVPVVGQEQCLRSNPAFAILTSEYTFCGGSRDGSGPCRGDSGDGFYVEVDGRTQLRGLVAHAVASNSSTCDLEAYIVFADLARERAWIDNILKPRSDLPPDSIRRNID